jgi:hypothetical protein
MRVILLALLAISLAGNALLAISTPTRTIGSTHSRSTGTPRYSGPASTSTGPNPREIPPPPNYATLTDCQKRVAFLDDQLLRADIALLPLLDAKERFERGSPNDDLVRAATPLFAPILTSNAGVNRSFNIECRDETCRLAVLHGPKDVEWGERLQKDPLLKRITKTLMFEGSGPCTDVVYEQPSNTHKTLVYIVIDDRRF